MDEVFGLVQRELTSAGFAGQLSAGVVLTGGGATMPGSAELASEVFGTGARVGVPTQNVGGLVDTVDGPRFATVVGLAQYGANRIALGAVTSARRTPIGKGMEGITAKLKFWLQDFF
jgi:cell division protein FtsA